MKQKIKNYLLNKIEYIKKYKIEYSILIFILFITLISPIEFTVITIITLCITLIEINAKFEEIIISILVIFLSFNIAINKKIVFNQEVQPKLVKNEFVYTIKKDNELKVLTTDIIPICKKYEYIIIHTTYKKFGLTYDLNTRNELRCLK